MKPNHKDAAHRELISKLQLQNELMIHLDHLLPTPINTIIEKVEELQTGIYGAFDTEQIDWLSKIYDATRHLQTLVNKISEVVKITKEGLTIIPISAQKIANTCLRLIDEPANEKQLKISLFLDPAVTIIYADEKYLKAILFHLLKQAVESASEASEINLEIRRNAEKGLLELTVLDSNNREDKFFFFSLFSRLDDFSLFFYLTELHGGNISVKSINKGTCFTVSLPWHPLTDTPASNETEQTLLAYLQQKHEHQEQMVSWIEKAEDATLSHFLTNPEKMQAEQKRELKEQMVTWIEKGGITIPGGSYLYELRSPLCAIFGPVEMLLEECEAPINAEQSKQLRTIYENAQFFLSVINIFLDMVKIKVGKLELGAKKTFPITAEELELHYIEKLAQEKHLKMTFTLDPTVITIQAYEDHFWKILRRLFENAIRFTKEQGVIDLTVRGDVEHGMAHFIISDTGKGMTEEEVNNFFNKQPFVDDHLNNAHSRLVAWTPDKLNEDLNLSLSLVYHLVKLHGGQISVFSEIGKGSRFTVSLPWQPVTHFNGE